MKTCKDCGKELSSSAKQCPNCGKDQRNFFKKHKFLTFIGVIVLLGVIGSAINASGGGAKTVTANIGDTAKTKTFEASITKIEQLSVVGAEFFKSSPAQGGTYVCVQWKYKNISDKAIGAFSQPSVSLVDSKGVAYSLDIGASGSYATTLKLTEKLLSDINPGITVTDAAVFEVSKETYAQGSWKIIIHADQDISVKVK